MNVCRQQQTASSECKKLPQELHTSLLCSNGDWYGESPTPAPWNTFRLLLGRSETERKTRQQATNMLRGSVSLPARCGKGDLSEAIFEVLQRQQILAAQFVMGA